MVIKNIFKAFILTCFLSGCKEKTEKLPFYNTADFTAEWIDAGNAAYPKIHTIDTFSFKNQLGHIVNKDSLNGHVYLANFFFCSCPGICPKMVSNLNVLQNAFVKEPQVKIVSFTVMPWRDSVKILYNYGLAHHINPNKWYLLTGNKDQIYKLGRLSYFSEKKAGLNKGPDDFLHTESLLLIDKKSRIRGIYSATDTAQIRRAEEDVRVLLKEKE